ncbi:hypothetical protein VPH35_000291 [Triticum aestivum]
MEATALSIGKSVLDGALGYAKSALAEEVALQLGVRRDQVFITNELEMMQAFLMTAHDERYDDDRVVKVWVKQVRDVAYDVEDTLQEFAVRLEKQSWWRIRRTLLDRRRVAKLMKELRANVEDVSQRNMRYHLVRSKPVLTAAEQSAIASATLFGIDGARNATKYKKSNVDLAQLLMVNKDENTDLGVIAVWGTSADLGQTSIIRVVYENPDIKTKFPCRAWVRLTHPFDSKDFIQSLVKQFYTAVGATVLFGMEMTTPFELAEKFDWYVKKKRYLIVLNGLSTIEEWDWVKGFFPDNNLGSRIIVSTTQVEVASLCVGQESIVSQLNQLSADQNIYAFNQKGCQGRTGLTTSNTTSTGVDNNSTSSAVEILPEQSKGDDGKHEVKNRITRIKTMVAALEESHLVGRKKEKGEIIKLISNRITQLQVISVWGMGGLGKTTLVKDIYQSEEVSGKFEKRAWVTIMRPFNLEELLRSLVMQLDRESSRKMEVVGLMGNTMKKFLLMSPAELIKELARLLEGKRYFIVVDDVSSTMEWNMIVPIFHDVENTCCVIVTTREETIAKHCSEKQENIYMLTGLEYKDARDLFTKKVFKQNMDLDKQYPELVEQAEMVLRKCNGLPLAVVTIGGFLANQPKSALEWRKLNEHISAELEMNPEFGTIKTVLMRSYDGLPYHLKSCFLYMPIFPEDCKVGRGRLAGRWSAEGYSREVRGKSAKEIADSYFLELISRSMILPSQQSIHSRKGISSCQVHDLIREIGIAKSMEENLVFTLEEGCSSNSQTTVRHLVISSNWKGDKSEFESMVDMSRLRSVTCFGEWKSFFVSDKMRLLRVLDLEDTTGVYSHHLKHIGMLLHLRYLSLRGCDDVSHLPDSLGNLRQLETLDSRQTLILLLPKTIIKLRKLNNLHAGRLSVDEVVSIDDEFVHEFPRGTQNRPCLFCLMPLLSCIACCAPQCVFHGGNFSHRDACRLYCCLLLPAIAIRLDLYGVLLPRGMRKLKALRTLGVVNIGRRGKYAVQDIKGLTQLRKLGVTGVNKENGQELCSAIVGLTRMESLSIRSEGEPGLCGCLDGKFSFPETLQSLKLYGNLVKLPEWVKGLKNLVKLKLRSSRILEHDTTIQLLGDLPNLAFLHLLKKSFQHGDEVCLSFHRDMFPSLVVLELDLIKNLKLVKFEEGATPKLELLKFRTWDSELSVGLFSGLPSLWSLKEFMLDNDDYNEDSVEGLRHQLAANQNGPVLKRF